MIELTYQELSLILDVMVYEREDFTDVRDQGFYERRNEVAQTKWGKELTDLIAAVGQLDYKLV